MISFFHFSFLKTGKKKKFDYFKLIAYCIDTFLTVKKSVLSFNFYAFLNVIQIT